MNFACNIPAFSILLLMLSGVLCIILKEKAAARFASIVIGIVLIANLYLLGCFIGGMEPFTYSMGHFGSPYGNELRAGLLEAMLAVLFSAVCLLSIMGGRSHIHHDIFAFKVNLFYISAIFLLCSMLALNYTNDLFTAYVFIEINTITACAIVMSKDDGRTLAATMSYLIMSLVGSGLFLLSVCILYGITGNLLMEPIRAVLAIMPATSQYRVAVNVALAMFAVALALKSALWPFSFWLPEAHSNATASSSAILSGLVLKAYIITLIKIIYRVIGFETVSASVASDLLLVFGAAAMIMGSLKAYNETNIKRMLAYSSIGQIGYIFCGIGLGTTLGMTAAVIQIGVHAVTKSMLFIASGGLMDVSGGSKNYRALTGAGARDPFAGAAFIVGSMSMIGIPFFAGFATKYTLVMAITNTSGWQALVAIAAVVVSTLLTAVYYFKALTVIFRDAEMSRSGSFLKGFLARCRALGVEYKIATALLIAANIAIGLHIDGLILLIENGLAVFG